MSAVRYYYLDNLNLKLHNYEVEPCQVELPNTFSPNNDGANDNYDLSEYLYVFDIYIVNRWGNTVFQLSKDNTSWDGNAKNGEPCSDGVYFYQVRNKETKENIKSGFIHLFR